MWYVTALAILASQDVPDYTYYSYLENVIDDSSYESLLDYTYDRVRPEVEALYLKDYLTKDCFDSVESFVLNDPSDLSDTDLDIARLKLLPYYVRECPDFADALGDYEGMLETEKKERVSWGSMRFESHPCIPVCLVVALAHFATVCVVLALCLLRRPPPPKEEASPV